MLFACTGVVLAQSTSPERAAPDSSQRPSEKTEHHHIGHHHEQGPKATKSGIFAYITGGETPSGDHEHEVEYFITDEQGKETNLQLTDEAVLLEALKDLGVSKKLLKDGGPQPLVGKRVTIEGRWTSDDVEGERGSNEDKIKVENIQNVQSDNEKSKFDFEADSAVTGSKPAVTIACRYAGNTAEPKTISYFNSLVGGTTKPGIDHFWRETSYNQINLSGSQVVGWYTLPRTRAQYLNSDGSANLGLLAQDCTGVADSSVFFPNYSTINLMFNDEIDGSAWGGFRPMTLDGQTITYGMTWMPPWGYGNVGILGHEMGHSYGLPHSSGPYSQTYDSWWDVMSSGGLLRPNLVGRTDCYRDATYGCMAMHTISAHKDKLGWIPSGQKYTAASGSQQTVTIDRLGTATSTSGNYLMARIPINGSTTRFYTVEARRPVGYDAHAAADGLVIHEIDTSQAVGLTRFAYVVDSDNNGNPNDAGAAWTPGETFTDSANSVSVQVTGSTTSGYTVRIQNGGSTAPANDNFASAQALTGSSATVNGTNNGATKETGEPNHAAKAGGKSVWYRWTPQSNGTVEVNTAGSSFDTLLAVYTGGAVNSLTPVASNDDDPSGGTRSKVSFAATAGTTYRIAVDGYNAATGSIALNLASSSTGGDTTLPNVSLTAPAADAVVRGTAVTLSADATDNVGVDRVQFLVNGTGVGTDSAAPYSLTWDTETVADGRHNLTARAFDAASNQQTSTARRVIVDNFWPNSTITAGPAQGSFVRSTSASFRFTSTDPASTFKCGLGSGAVQACSTGKTYTGLLQGRHTFTVWAIGSAGADGDTEQQPSTRSWFVDTARPSGTVLINGGAGVTKSPTVTLRLSATDPAPASGTGKMRFSNNGTTWSAWQTYATSKSWTLTSGAGTKTVWVQYQDRAGNLSATVKDAISYRP